MRQVRKSETISPKDSDIHMFYGVVSNGATRGFVTRYRCNGGPYQLRTVDVTEGGGWSDWASKDTLEELLNIVLQNPNFQVFEFGTSRELFTWLANA